MRENSTGNGNAITHGAYRFIASGDLPADLRGLDKEMAGEILEMCGGDKRFRLMATATARAYVITQLVWQHIERTYDPDSKELPAGLKVFGSYQESLRRNLEAMGLTPMSASKIKVDNDPLTHAKAIAAMKRGKHE